MDHQDKLEAERRLWQQRIKDFESTKLTISQYAKINDLSVHQLYYWRARFKAPSSVPDSSSEHSSPMVKVVNPKNESSSRLPDPKWIAELIKALYS